MNKIKKIKILIREQEQRGCGNRARCKCENVLLCVCGNARKLLERN